MKIKKYLVFIVVGYLIANCNGYYSSDDTITLTIPSPKFIYNILDKTIEKVIQAAQENPQNAYNNVS